MLSFLQQRFGKILIQPEKKMMHQQSIESAFSRVTARHSSNDASTTPSMTTATSLTDTPIQLTKCSVKPVEHKCNSARLPATIDNYNEDVLSANNTSSSRKVGDEVDERIISGDTLVDDHNDDGNKSREHLLQQCVQALGEDWDIGAMPGDELRLSENKERPSKRRKSTRLELLGKKSGMNEKTTSVLGKRGCETVDAGIEKFQALKGATIRSALRPRISETPNSEGPSRKRARFSNLEIIKRNPPEPVVKRVLSKKPVKRWLDQGLYVGQDPDFDPRLTETKNKLKKASINCSGTPKRTLMQLPMFAGDRTLAMGRNFRLPFDIFSPLPPGQPKPDEWKKTQKNVFFGDAAHVWKKPKSLEHSTCICTLATGCDDNCFNRFMLYECDDSNCKLGAEHCTNRSFAALKRRCKAGGKYNIGVEVIKTVDRGYGIRSNRTFEPNQIIVEYTGEIITQEECDGRMKKRYKDAECYYLMDFDQSMILDATRGSIARFVNHSCAPNCRMIKWTVAGKPRVALFAGDNGIMTGEELTYDYNFDPYSVKNVQECRCRAEGCRGVLGPKPKEMREAPKPMTRGGKRIFRQVIEDAVGTVTKKRKIAVASSVKSADTTTRAETSKRLMRARALGSSTAQRESLVKKVSKCSLKGVARKTTRETVGNGKERRGCTVKYSRRRSSVASSAGVDSESEILNRRSPAKGRQAEKAERPKSRRESVKTGVKENVVRTMRGSNRGTPGKTMWVMGDDEFKGWRDS